MKIKRLTFTKFIVRICSILIPLMILYHWVPNELRKDAPILYMALTIAVYSLGRFIGRELTTD